MISSWMFPSAAKADIDLNAYGATEEVAEKVVTHARKIPQALKRKHIFNDLRHEWNSCPSLNLRQSEFFRSP
jgi:hypothetical protein